MLGSMLAGTVQGGGKIISKAYHQDEFDVNDDGVIQILNLGSFKSLLSSMA